MNLNQWREKKKPIEAVLPSGLAVKLRKVNMEKLVSSGLIPVVLLDEVAKNPGKTLDLPTEKVLSDLPTYMSMIDGVVKGAMADPEVTDDPTDTTIGVDELDLADKMFILAWAMEDTNALRPFRAEPEQLVGSAPDGAQIQQAT